MPKLGTESQTLIQPSKIKRHKLLIWEFHFLHRWCTVYIVRPLLRPFLSRTLPPVYLAGNLFMELLSTGSVAMGTAVFQTVCMWVPESDLQLWKESLLHLAVETKLFCSCDCNQIIMLFHTKKYVFRNVTTKSLQISIKIAKMMHLRLSSNVLHSFWANVHF